MPQKRPLSDLLSNDVIVVLVSSTDAAARAFRFEHNSPYLYDEKPKSSTSRPRTDRDSTPEYNSEPVAKIVLKFSHAPRTSDGYTFGSEHTSCNILLDKDQKCGISRTQFCISFDRKSKAVHVMDVSSHGTELTTRTFLKDDEESKILNASHYLLSRTSLALSENDEIRAGVVVLKVAVLRRPEPNTIPWGTYSNQVDKFIQQCDKIPASGRGEKSGVPTVLDPTILAILGPVGKGSYAQVLKMIDSRGSVKTPLHKGFNDIIQAELDCLKKLSHKHIVSVVNGKVPPFGGPAIIMDYIPMTLERFSSSNMPAVHLRHLMGQLLEALDYAHDHSIVHRDVKPSNILVETLAPLRIKLSDFGVSSIIKKTMTTFCGTLRYKAPEISVGKSYTDKVDVCTEKNTSTHQTMEEEIELTPAIVTKHLQSDKRAFRNLLEIMLVRNPEYRGSSETCLKFIPPLSDIESGNMAQEVIAPDENTCELPPTLPITTIRPKG
ncbi:hypothetical protein MMC13_000772 [Lambiella insularis]|nr:hypothetical protein [Lambiella insularis]